MTAGPRRTLRAQLLVYLLVPLGLLWAVDALHTFLTVRAAINAAYDRALYASALAISERVTLSGTTPVVDIPPVALEVLDTATHERLFYRVGYRVGEGEDVFVTGYPDLPQPTARPSDAPVFYDQRYRGDEVRVSALRTDFPTEPRVTVLVQVAETVGGRGGRTQALVARELVSQLLLIALAAGTVWLGIARGLRPLTRVSRDVAHRSAVDLTAIAPQDVPQEVAPLVFAVNDLMARLRTTIAAQRRFIADASHQLRTPLAVVQAKAELALREEDPAAVMRALADVHEHSKATTHLATQLLSLARADPEQAGETRVLDLVALARQACASLVPYAYARDVDLGFEGEGELRVMGREHLLREALSNLVQNAVHYGMTPGTVTVSVSRRDGRAVLAVEDDGPGIPEEERSRVVERFYRRPGTRSPGAGLGLAIVKQIADGHGAGLHLMEGAGGRGLRVELRFTEAT
ncbi:sensor histidine kinase [Anaeromyxobacter sp. SG26]|uniref:sensor histidine kinase n=1 Tax=Anaeromyxobacter sp. SG26 TaxID=2925407 RepID=UPI001F5A4F93|nr:sensor histidine kinase [Anaeromyxobacter sp. SG26]